MGLRLVTCEMALVVKVRKEAQRGDWYFWEDQTPSTVQMDKCRGLK